MKQMMLLFSDVYNWNSITQQQSKYVVEPFALIPRTETW